MVTSIRGAMGSNTLLTRCGRVCNGGCGNHMVVTVWHHGGSNTLCQCTLTEAVNVALTHCANGARQSIVVVT